MNKVKYNSKEKVSIERLRKTDSHSYAELCERAGYLTTAFNIHFTEGNLEYALELAKQLNDIPLKKRQELVDKLEREYEELTRATPSRGLGGAWADAYSESFADTKREKGKEGLLKISEIRKELGLE